MERVGDGAGFGQRLRRMRRWGLGTRTLKTAVAAALAWALGGLVPGAPPQPYLAPVTALLTVQVTVAETLTAAAQRTVGAVVGVAVALLAGRTIGITPWTIGLLVLVAQAIGALLRLSALGTSQVMVSSLLVLTVGEAAGAERYGWARVAETVVGALVGIAVNALVAPPSYVPEARTAWRGLASGVTAHVEELAAAVSAGITGEQARRCLERARSLLGELRRAEAALVRAEGSLRFNVRGPAYRAQLVRYRRALAALEHATVQTRGIARVLNDATAAGATPPWLKPDGLGRPLGALLACGAGALEAFGAVVEEASGDGESGTGVAGAASLAETVSAGTEQRRTLVAAAGAQAAVLPSEGWVELGSIVADVDRLLGDLAAAAADLTGQGAGRREDEAPRVEMEHARAAGEADEVQA